MTSDTIRAHTISTPSRSDGTDPVPHYPIPKLKKQTHVPLLAIRSSLLEPRLDDEPLVGHRPHHEEAPPPIRGH